MIGNLILGENTVTISDVIPILDSLETHHLKENAEKDTSLTNEIRSRVSKTLFLKYQKFSEILNANDYHVDLCEISQVLLISTFLDPRYKAAYCSLDLLVDLLMTFLVKDGHLSERCDGEQDEAKSDQVDPDNTEPSVKKKKLSVLQSIISNRAAVPETSSATSTMSLREKLDIEIKVYTSGLTAHDEMASYILSY